MRLKLHDEDDQTWLITSWTSGMRLRSDLILEIENCLRIAAKDGHVVHVYLNDEPSLVMYEDAGIVHGGTPRPCVHSFLEFLIPSSR